VELDTIVSADPVRQAQPALPDRWRDQGAVPAGPGQLRHRRPAVPETPRGRTPPVPGQRPAAVPDQVLCPGSGAVSMAAITNCNGQPSSTGLPSSSAPRSSTGPASACEAGRHSAPVSPLSHLLPALGVRLAGQSAFPLSLVPHRTQADGSAISWLGRAVSTSSALVGTMHGRTSRYGRISRFASVLRGRPLCLGVRGAYPPVLIPHRT
jgi:hypothetical protein